MELGQVLDSPQQGTHTKVIQGGSSDVVELLPGTLHIGLVTVASGLMELAQCNECLVKLGLKPLGCFSQEGLEVLALPF